jgi:thioesterase domain-containing protein
MNASEVEKYLHVSIPLSKAMQISVTSLQADGVTLSAPLTPNINHRETVFGGSASALAILAAWSLLYTRLEREAIACRLVIQRNTMSYDRPIGGTFSARSYLPQPDTWSAFIAMLARKRRARINICAVVEYQGQQAGLFEGVFVALSTQA